MKTQQKNLGILRGVFGILIIASVLFISSCKNDNNDGPKIPDGTGDNSLQITFAAKANGDDFALNDSFELAGQGFNYKFELFKFYIANLRLIRDDSTEVLLKDIALIDFWVDKPNLSIISKVDAASYIGIKFGLGVDSINNAKNPNSFLPEHPLSSQQGTYWDMATAYRFLLMEGRLDTVLTDSVTKYNSMFVVHTGTNQLYREKSFSRFLKFTKGDNKKLTIMLDVDGFLSNINFKTDHVSHTLGAGFPVAEKITDNFLSNITLIEQ